MTDLDIDIKKHFSELAELEKAHANEPNEIPHLRDLSIVSVRIAKCCNVLENFEEAEKFFQDALGYDLKSLEIDPKNPVSLIYISSTLDILGQFYNQQGDYKKAITMFERALGFDLKLKEVDTRQPWSMTDKETPYLNAARSYRKIGEIYDELGEDDKALENFTLSFRTYMEIHQEFKDKKHYLEALSILHDKMGEFYDFRGDLKNAEKNYRDQAELDEKLLDDNDDETKVNFARSCSQVTSILYQRGLIKESSSFVNKALKIREALFKKLPEDYDTINALSISLAQKVTLLKENEKLNKAIKFQKRKVDLERKLYADYPQLEGLDNYYIRSLYNLAEMYNETKQFDLAKDNYEQVKQEISIFDDKHAFYSSFLEMLYESEGELIEIYFKAGNYQKSYEEAVALNKTLNKVFANKRKDMEFIMRKLYVYSYILFIRFAHKNYFKTLIEKLFFWK